MRRYAIAGLVLLGLVAMQVPATSAARRPDATFTVQFVATGASMSPTFARQLRAFVAEQPLGTSYSVQGVAAPTRASAAAATARVRVTVAALQSQGALLVQTVKARSLPLAQANSIAARRVIVNAFHPAVVAAPKFTVNYHAGIGGVARVSDTYTVGGLPLTLPKPEAPRGYAFMGWYSTEGGGSYFGAAGAGYTPLADTEMFAVWRQMTTTFHITILNTVTRLHRAGSIEGCLDSCTAVVQPRMEVFNNLQGPLFDKDLRVQIGSSIVITLPGNGYAPMQVAGTSCVESGWPTLVLGPVIYTCTGFTEGVPASFTIDNFAP